MATAKIYQSRSTKRRRTKEDIRSLRDALLDVVRENRPMTVRQVFYQAVSCGLIEKTEAQYKNTVVRLLTDMRIDGDLPFNWIADNTRWMRKPYSYSSMESAIRRTAETYRRSVWDSQDVYVELWLEKDALSGVLYEVTAPWDVPLMVSRGYSSVTYLYTAAETIIAQNKPAYLYYFGDYDPSGVDIPRNVEARLRQFAPGAEIRFERVAVNFEQIEAMQLPTRPTKKTDSRSKAFEGESVEVDAIPPGALRQLAEQCIAQHVDQRQYEMMQTAEVEERKILEMFAGMEQSHAFAVKYKTDPASMAQIRQIIDAAARDDSYRDLVDRIHAPNANIDRIYREYKRRTEN
jgi:hypothetical protein